MKLAFRLVLLNGLVHKRFWVDPQFFYILFFFLWAWNWMLNKKILRTKNTVCWVVFKTELRDFGNCHKILIIFIRFLVIQKYFHLTDVKLYMNRIATILLIENKHFLRCFQNDSFRKCEILEIIKNIKHFIFWSECSTICHSYCERMTSIAL